jgi:SAM-dependent methyltransferase
MTAVAGSTERLRALAGPRLTLVGRCLLRGLPLPRWGNLRRVSNRALITGRVLEVQMPSYTKRYGRGVQESHSIDIDPKFSATYTRDLADAPEIPSDDYDCFLLPNTLQHVEALRPALQTMLRVTKPGGTLLASAAGFLPLIDDGGDFWRLSAQGWRRLLADAWRGCEIAVEDPRYPVLVTIRCRKPEERPGR